MKAMSVAMVAAVLLSTLGAHAGDTVTSVNVVGYYSVTIPADGLALITPVLESFQPNTIALKNMAFVSTITCLGGSGVERQPRKLLAAGSIPARGSISSMVLGLMFN